MKSIQRMRGIAVLAFMFALTSAATAGAYSAKSYVQEGLYAQWDGIENAGWGTHDSAAAFSAGGEMKLTAVEGTGVISIPEGTVVGTHVALMNGARIARGCYTGSGKRGKKVPWLSGSGFILVADGLLKTFPAFLSFRRRGSSFYSGSSHMVKIPKCRAANLCRRRGYRLPSPEIRSVPESRRSGFGSDFAGIIGKQRRRRQ